LPTALTRQSLSNFRGAMVEEIRDEKGRSASPATGGSP
jgi:hypothetical protein